MYEGHTALQIAGQAVIGVFFIFHGVKNVLLWQFNLERTAAEGVPFPAACLVSGFIIQFSGAFMVLFDTFTRLGVVLLIVFTVLASALFHRFWKMENPLRHDYHFLLLTYNGFVIGALLLIM